MCMFFTIQGCLGDMNFSVPRGGKEASPRLLMDNEDLVRAFSTVIRFTIFHESVGGAATEVQYQATFTSSPINEVNVSFQ